MADHPNYNAEASNLERVCRYFGCRIEELVEYRPDPTESEPSPKPKRTVTKGKKDAAAEKAARANGFQVVKSKGRPPAIGTFKLPMEHFNPAKARALFMPSWATPYRR